jgi:hypothetical protein
MFIEQEKLPGNVFTTLPWADLLQSTGHMDQPPWRAKGRKRQLLHRIVPDGRV